MLEQILGIVPMYVPMAVFIGSLYVSVIINTYISSKRKRNNGQEPGNAREN
jgi:hypothetical protein